MAFNRKIIALIAAMTVALFLPALASAVSGKAGAAKWGAVALDAKLSKFGGSEGHSSEGQAIKAAIRQCKANGGGKDCNVNKNGRVWSNQCGALAWGDTKAMVFSASTHAAATQGAMDACSRVNANCEIFYAGCSFPQQPN
jgi:Domain of unknown function (DUF4189)